MIAIFSFLNENICCGYSFEASQWDASNEHHNKRFRPEMSKILHFSVEIVGLLYLHVGVIVTWSKHFLNCQLGRIADRYQKIGDKEFLHKEPGEIAKSYNPWRVFVAELQIVHRYWLISSIKCYTGTPKIGLGEILAMSMYSQ